MTGEKQLTLCVITKNDEAFLPECLNSMREVSDEMLVADLGSQDQTIPLAEQAGAIVYRPKWENDFSKIRNFCMEHAAGKWVLFLQADETLSKDQQKELRFLLKNPNAEGYLISVGYDHKERDISSPAEFLRLFRNRKEYRFCFRSFEYIPDEVLYSVCESHLHLSHIGKKTVGWQIEEKLRLLKEDIKENPKNSYIRYLEGIELMNQGKYLESIAPFEQARKTLEGGRFYVPHLYKLLAKSLLSQNRFQEAEKILSDGFKLFPFYNDLWALRAEVYHCQNWNEEAINDLKTCLNLRRGINACVPEPEYDTAAIQKMLKEIEDTCEPQ